MDNTIVGIAEQLNNLHASAYHIYKEQVTDICSREASRSEVEHLLDYMLDFCGDEKILHLFKKVCRQYLQKYPDVIESEIQFYKEYYDIDKEA